MRFWKPIVELGTRLPTQTRREEKFGGAPWGLPASRWPSCAQCRTAMSLVAQLEHAADRLDLGRAGRVMFVFHCNDQPGACETWDAYLGANAAFVLEPEDLVEEHCASPAGVREDVEVRVLEWVERDDGVPSSERSKFFSEATRLAVPREMVERLAYGTRIGSVPTWIQSADDAPKPPWLFALQIDSGHALRWTPNNADEVGCTICRRHRDGTHSIEHPRLRRPGASGCITIDPSGCYCDGSNFGDGGTAYLFLRANGAGLPHALMFWQCG